MAPSARRGAVAAAARKLPVPSTLLLAAGAALAALCSGANAAPAPKGEKDRGNDWLNSTGALEGHDEDGVSDESKAAGSLPAWRRTGIVTFAGANSTEVIDAAVILGLSLQRHVPEFYCLCVVSESMSIEHKKLLTDVGWALMEVPSSEKDAYHNAHGAVNVFRVKWRRLIYLGPHFFLRNNDIYGLLEKYWLPRGKIGMVENCCSEGYEGGMMVFRPSLVDFRIIHEFLEKNPRSDPHQAVSTAFADRIVNLQGRWNVHGRSRQSLCRSAVLAHFTGVPTPTTPRARVLLRIKRGELLDHRSLNCTNLVEEYFQALQESSRFLSPQLRDALEQMDAEPPASNPPPLPSLKASAALPALGGSDSRSANQEAKRFLSSMSRWLLVCVMAVSGLVLAAMAMHLAIDAFANQRAQGEYKIVDCISRRCLIKTEAPESLLPGSAAAKGRYHAQGIHCL